MIKLHHIFTARVQTSKSRMGCLSYQARFTGKRLLVQFIKPALSYVAIDIDCWKTTFVAMSWAPLPCPFFSFLSHPILSSICNHVISWCYINCVNLTETELSLCSYYLVCSRIPVVLAGLEPYTPSQQDDRAPLWRSEVVQQSQVCSELQWNLQQHKKYIY